MQETYRLIELASTSSAPVLITRETGTGKEAPPERTEQGEAVLLPLGTTLEQGERELILRTLRSVNNNKTRAAAILGTTPKTLHNKARRWKMGMVSEAAVGSVHP